MVSFGVRGVCTTTPRVEMGLDSVTAQVQIKSYALGRRRKDETEKSRSIRAARAAVGWSGSFALGGPTAATFRHKAIGINITSL